MRWSHLVRRAKGTGLYQAAAVKGMRRQRRQRVVGGLILLAGIVPLLLSACGLQSNTGALLAADQTFVYPYTRGDSSTTTVKDPVFDPAAIAYAADSTFTSQLYSGLVTFSPDLQVVGDAATSWDVDATGTIYTFHLRPNMHFSDGTPLTATDFAYSINRALAPNLCDGLDRDTYGSPPPVANGSGYCFQGLVQGYLGHIVGALDYNTGAGSAVNGEGNNPKTSVNVIDPLTLQIRLDAPIAYFLQALTYPFSYPVEKKLIDRYPNGTWVQHLDEGGTNGPYKVAQYDATSKPQQIILEKNPYWEDAWGKKLTLQKIVRPIYGVVDNEYADYRAGKWDYTDVPSQSYFTAHGQGDFNQVPLLAENYFGLNFDQPPLNNLQVRQALSLALNKQLLVDRVENGGAIPTNHIVPKGQPGYYPGLVTPGSNPTQSLTGDQAQALQLLKAARATCNTFDPVTGLPPAECPFITGSHPEPINIITSRNATRVAIATFAAQQWNTILGLNMQVVPTDSPGKNLVQHGPYQMWVIGWLADYPDPQDWLSLQFTTNTGNNASDVHDPELDKVFKQADLERDPNKRMALYNQAEQMVVNLVPWITYEQSKALWRMRPWVRGFGLNSLGLMVDTAWPNVYISSH
ncbi:MAG TPA: peptide ABC transporter substrate-binding protein [Ktedonobacterales bacterium]|jgi:peptide/nickel transport system substrate-binding protein/oligopeptide transport system substrate-binding protein